MGNFIWSDWGQLLAITSGAWTVWGGLWAVFYRKYFWDFVGGKLGPTGIIAPGFAAPFISLIITMPIIQGVCIVNGILTVLFEWPVLPEFFFYRSLVLKIVFYTITAVACGLVYQTADAAVLYLVTILAYVVALSKGESVGEKATAPSKV